MVGGGANSLVHGVHSAARCAGLAHATPRGATCGVHGCGDEARDEQARHHGGEPGRRLGAAHHAERYRTLRGRSTHPVVPPRTRTFGWRRLSGTLGRCTSPSSGAGYVGLVTAACLAHLGHDVVCLDVDAARVARLRAGDLPVHEPGLDELVAEGLARRPPALRRAMPRPSAARSWPSSAWARSTRTRSGTAASCGPPSATSPRTRPAPRHRHPQHAAAGNGRRHRRRGAAIDPSRAHRAQPGVHARGGRRR